MQVLALARECHKSVVRHFYATPGGLGQCMNLGLRTQLWEQGIGQAFWGRQREVQWARGEDAKLGLAFIGGSKRLFPSALIYATSGSGLNLCRPIMAATPLSCGRSFIFSVVGWQKSLTCTRLSAGCARLPDTGQVWIMFQWHIKLCIFRMPSATRTDSFTAVSVITRGGEWHWPIPWGEYRFRLSFAQ